MVRQSDNQIPPQIHRCKNITVTDGEHEGPIGLPEPRSQGRMTSAYSIADLEFLSAKVHKYGSERSLNSCFSTNQFSRECSACAPANIKNLLTRHQSYIPIAQVRIYG